MLIAITGPSFEGPISNVHMKILKKWWHLSQTLLAAKERYSHLGLTVKQGWLPCGIQRIPVDS